MIESKSLSLEDKYKAFLKRRAECQRRWRLSNPEAQRACYHRYLTKLKQQAYQIYGGAFCKFCGITDTDVLCIDHINNDGAAHRKELSKKHKIGGWRILHHLRKLNWPAGFQILCHNCNYKKYITHKNANK